ncbi:MAG TPA: NUDIX hydrolase [Xanthobacteraceae bacterium]|nr:NUDIX hydrolase [Xanthobacteraceae bacterium]
MDFFLGGEGALEPAHAAAALILMGSDRYLMQLRDQKPGIFYPGHWGLFGGAIEPGESPEAAVRRELKEELGLAASDVRFATEFTFTLGRFGRVTRHFFSIAVDADAQQSLRLREGTAMRLFTAVEILNLPRVVPYDSFAIWLHAAGMIDP